VSHVTSFTGSTSGFTLTVPSGTPIAVGDVITAPAGNVAPKTYVVSGSGTTWTINNGQTIASETLTATAFPPGHGLAVNNVGTAPLTITTIAPSKLYGAAGLLTGGTQVAPGGPVTLFPGGQFTAQADTSNNYLVTDFKPGWWVQSASNIPLIQWTGLGGYYQYHLECSGIIPASSGDSLVLRVAYNGTFQSGTGTYNWVSTRATQGGSYVVDSPSTGPPDTTASAHLTGPINNPGDFSSGAGANVVVDMVFSDGTGTGYRRSYTATASENASGGATEAYATTGGAFPYSTAQVSITGIEVLMASGGNISTGWCQLLPL
jgi:hypothetical protein